MKRSLVLAIPIAALGLMLAAIPLWLLPVCAVHDGAAPMKCHWSGLVLAGFGGLFLLLALLLLLCRAPGVRMGISVVAILSAVVAGLAPTLLVGMCASPMMPCRTGTLPAVMITTALIALEGFFTIFYLRHTGVRKTRDYETSDNLAYSLKQS